MKRLRSSRGMTLTETLCVVLVVLLISAMLATGAHFSAKTYRESMELSETELLCSTLTAAISDKLRYAGEVRPDGSMFLDGVGKSTGAEGEETENSSFLINTDGEVVIQKATEEFKLLGSAAYPRGLRVRSDKLVQYNSASGLFTVSFAIESAQGEILKETTFEVKRINAVQ